MSSKTLNRIKFSTLFLILIFINCKNEEENDVHLIENGYKELNFGGSSTIPNIRFQYIDNQGLVSFYDRDSHTINIFDYQTNNLINKIKLAKNGDNSISTPYYWLDYYIHNLDSIFISTVKNIYLINDKGEILNKITPKINTNYFKINRPIFNETTSYKNGALSFETVVLLPDLKDTVYLRINFDFFSNNIKEEYISIKEVLYDYENILNKKKELFKKGGFDMIPKHMVVNNDNFIISTPISDSIYIFKKGKLINKYLVSDSLIKLANYNQFFDRKEIIKSGNTSAIKDKTVQPPFFINMFIDKNYLYRILSHGTRGRKVYKKDIYPKYLIDSISENDYVLKGASLCIFDLKTHINYVVSLPINELDISLENSIIFVTNQEIHIPTNTDKINSNSLTFKIYRIKEN
jgi:Domain of unknown function (DUF4221)